MISACMCDTEPLWRAPSHLTEKLPVASTWWAAGMRLSRANKARLQTTRPSLDVRNGSEAEISSHRAGECQSRRLHRT